MGAANPLTSPSTMPPRISDNCTGNRSTWDGGNSITGESPFFGSQEYKRITNMLMGPTIMLKGSSLFGKRYFKCGNYEINTYIQAPMNKRIVVSLKLPFTTSFRKHNMIPYCKT